MKKIFLLTFFLTAVFISSVYSEKIFSILSRGVVKDDTSGLIWTRCSLSNDDKPIYEFNCKGERKIYTWDEAVEVCNKLTYEGRSDWRLPNIKELQSIVFYHHYTGAQNISQVVSDVFPNTVSISDAEAISNCRQMQLDTRDDYYPFLYNCSFTDIHYWSSTIHVNNNNIAWFVDFFSGNSAFAWSREWLKKKAFVRCVAGP